ncbi:DEHA2B00154p [Debaryomyces hansenii CBS767]|uniref:DEHA2B00154p n=1 Tax=Debaryomyces hansenii (strain ATCC 36239 / CBS 767 / BCRC 21394 / JCM 1990 / NBRC 0083 / IGC 2968) TaxID=284592 RepID=Q6BXU6_DEBHA|nr:DEHA2B00154p [Debaryomyces hansenii CBS767]CAG84953.1 DEHA2B00154p [Debaryomyces hansenii CBS767]|eukprot:XP_456973.1 DEHA2B00154p [Debaryomyces hansenii CBS767]
MNCLLQHYSTNGSEIPGVKESKLNACKLASIMPQSHTLIIILEQNTGSIATSNSTSSEQPGMQFPTKSAAFPIYTAKKKTPSHPLQ